MVCVTESSLCFLLASTVGYSSGCGLHLTLYLEAWFDQRFAE